MLDIVELGEYVIRDHPTCSRCTYFNNIRVDGSSYCYCSYEPTINSGGNRITFNTTGADRIHCANYTSNLTARMHDRLIMWDEFSPYQPIPMGCGIVPTYVNASGFWFEGT